MLYYLSQFSVNSPSPYFRVGFSYSYPNKDHHEGRPFHLARYPCCWEASCALLTDTPSPLFNMLQRSIILSALLALVAPLYVQSAEPAPLVKVPPAARITEIPALLSAGTYTPGRPADDRAARKRVAQFPAVRRYHELAEKELGEPPSVLTPVLFERFNLTDTRQEYEKPSARMTTRLAYFTIAECIEDQGRYLPSIETELATILAQET